MHLLHNKYIVSGVVIQSRSRSKVSTSQDYKMNYTIFNSQKLSKYILLRKMHSKNDKHYMLKLKLKIRHQKMKTMSTTRPNNQFVDKKIEITPLFR